MSSTRKRLVRAGVGGAVAIGALALLAGTAGAQDEVMNETASELTGDDVQIVLNNIWVMIAAVLVIFMQAGFALVEAGLTRAKNVSNIFAKNLVDFLLGVIAFATIGFAFAFGPGNDFVGTSGWFLNGETFSEPFGTIELPTFFLFQVAFAATAATIVSGAMAERTKFKSYFVYSFLISAFVYPIIVHWTWGGGWLSTVSENGETAYIDFAGSSIVHMVGGVSALIGAAFLGARIGKYTKDGKPRAIPGHSVPFAILGVFILFIGWFGFNPGSELAADSAVPAIAVTTLIAGAVGGALSLLIVWLKEGKPDVAMMGNGVLAGLVGVTAGCAHVNNWGAAIIGGICGVVVVFAVFGIDRLKIDDPVGAVSVHGVCGALGTVLVGVFATTQGSPLGDASVDGLLAGGGADQLIKQLTGVGAIAAFTAIAMTIVFAGIKYTIGLRVSEEEEIEGLDVHEHGVPGYAPDIALGESSVVGGSKEMAVT